MIGFCHVITIIIVNVSLKLKREEKKAIKIKLLYRNRLFCDVEQTISDRTCEQTYLPSSLPASRKKKKRNPTKEKSGSFRDPRKTSKSISVLIAE